MSKIRRKVTVENTEIISDSTSRRPSVFERLGPSAGNSDETQCCNWMKTGKCKYGNTCRFIHGPSPRGKGYSSTCKRSPERPPGDLRERMKNKHQEVDYESQKRTTEESTSPLRQKDPSRERHKEKKDIKMTKERTPESDEEAAEWDTTRDEKKRQGIQRELMKLEKENLEKREDIAIKKKTSPEVMPKMSPSPRKSSRSPKRKISPKPTNVSGKKEKNAVASSPILDPQTRHSNHAQSKNKDPRTQSPPPPIQKEALFSKKHKEKHKTKEHSDERLKDLKERGRDVEKPRDKKEKQRDASGVSHRQKLSSPADRSCSNSRDYSPPAPRRRHSSSPAPTKTSACKNAISPSHRSVSPSGHHHSPMSSRHHSPSSQSGSSVQRHSPSPCPRRSPSPPYHRTASPTAIRQSTSPSPQRKRSPSRHRSPAREQGRRDRERASASWDRRQERRDESRGRKAKDRKRDERHRDHDGEPSGSSVKRDDRESHDVRDRREVRENRDHRERRDSQDNWETRDSRDYRDSKESHDQKDSRSACDAHEYRDDIESHRKDEQYDGRNYRNRGKDNTVRAESRNEMRNYSRNENRSDTRNYLNGRARERAPDPPEKAGSAARSSQVDNHSSSNFHDNWKSRSSYAERDRYDSCDRGRDQNRQDRDRDQRPMSPVRHQGRNDDTEKEERREERRVDKTDERAREREHERERVREREQREGECEKERESEREHACERERGKKQEKDRERQSETERERDRGQGGEREKERDRGRERDRDHPRDWKEKEKAREDRRDKRDDVREEQSEIHEDRKPKKRERNESSLSPRQSPKRHREHSPDSDAYNSGEKNEKHRLLRQVVEPLNSRFKVPIQSPVHVTEARQSRWKEEERKSERKESSRRYEESETKENTIPAPDTVIQHKAEERDISKKIELQKKAARKKKEDEVLTEKSTAESRSDDVQVFSPKKGQKKKSIEKKRKKSKGDSDVSDEEVVQPSKKKKGPRIPSATAAPVSVAATIKEEVIDVLLPEKKVVEISQEKETTFSDWSDEDVPKKKDPLEKTIGEPIKKLPKAKIEKARPATAKEPSSCKPLEQKRSSSNQSRTSSCLRSPSIESVHRSGEDHNARTRLFHGNSRNQERNKSIETTGERKSRIDQLKRGEPNCSSSSDCRDSRSHSSRRSSPESDRQVHSRSGSFDSRERATERERSEYERECDKHRERERREGREWDRNADIEWPRTRDYDRIRERDRERERDRRRDIESECDKVVPDNTGRERERLLNMPSIAEPKCTNLKERDLDKIYENSSRNTSAVDKIDRNSDNMQDMGSSHKNEKPESFDGGDVEEPKLDEYQSVDSVAGEEYEPISDDELDEILADDAEKKKDHQQDDDKPSDPLDVIDVDWSSLMPKQPKEPLESGAALLKFTPAAVLLRVGISKSLAGQELFNTVRDLCQQSLEKPKATETLFDHDLGALNMSALLRKQERASLLGNLGPCCKALCSRRDLAIRKQLVQNEKVTVKPMYLKPPVVDSELLRLSLHLFKRKLSSLVLNQEKSDNVSDSSKKAEPCVC